MYIAMKFQPWHILEIDALPKSMTRNLTHAMPGAGFLVVFDTEEEAREWADDVLEVEKTEGESCISGK